MKNKGFTLIEILVVVTIIGILVSVVLVLMYSAKGKANIVSIKTSLNSVAPAGAMCRDGGGIIQNGNGGDNICDVISITNTEYPLISRVCGSNPADTQFTVIHGSDSNWKITLICSGFDKCDGNGNAYCDATGCHFPNTGTCN